MKTARDDWRLIQAILGTAQDGIPGARDAAALEILRTGALAEYKARIALPDPVTPRSEVDERSEKNIRTLLPEVQPTARKFLLEVNRRLSPGFLAKIISGNRTYAEQDALYAQGRTKPGKIVTRAKGGQSDHNFQIAWDIGIFRGADYLGESAQYAVAVGVGREMGLDVGHDWRSFKDTPHFGIKTGLTLAQMRARVAAGKSVLA